MHKFFDDTMKRLLRISFDSFIISFIPIIAWFMLGLTVDSNLINVFTITYPIQFIWSMLKSIFSVGPNVYKEKEKNENAVMNGMFCGIILGFIIFLVLILNVNSYISYMHMDPSIYHNFTIYSLTLLYLQLIFSFIQQKLYFENKNAISNKYTLVFNLLNLVSLFIISILVKNQFVIIFVTLLTVSLYLLSIVYREFNNFKFDIKILKYIRYDSVDLAGSLLFFFIFLFGLSNAMEFGPQYALALTFITLITDTQWDTLDSIKTLAKVDISKNEFNFKKTIKNSYKLLSLMFLSIAILFICLFKFYHVDPLISLFYLSFSIGAFLVWPIYTIKTVYLQINYSAVEITSNKTLSNIIRFILSLLKTPYCTAIGELTSALYQTITVSFIFNKHFKVNKKGEVTTK